MEDRRKCPTYPGQQKENIVQPEPPQDHYFRSHASCNKHSRDCEHGPCHDHEPFAKVVIDRKVVWHRPRKKRFNSVRHTGGSGMKLSYSPRQDKRTAHKDHAARYARRWAIVVPGVDESVHGACKERRENKSLVHSVAHHIQSSMRRQRRSTHGVDLHALQTDRGTQTHRWHETSHLSHVSSMAKSLTQ